MALRLIALLVAFFGPLLFAQTDPVQSEDILRDYRKAARLDPRSFEAHYNLALLLLQRKDLAAGLAELRRAEQLRPNSPDVRFNLGVILIESGRPAEALSHLRRARELQPDRPDVQFQIVRAYLALHRAGDAKKEADEFTAKNAEGSAAVGQLFLAAGREADAVPYFEQAIKSGVHTEEARSLLAEAWLQLKKPDQVLAAFSSPSTASDHFFRGEALLDLGNLPGALAEAERATELEPTNARYLLFKARLHQREGDTDAGSLLQQAIQADPGWFEPHYSYAVDLYFARNYDGAARELKQALQSNSSCARCVFLLGVVRLVQGQTQDAESSFRRATALEPENSRFHTHLGALLLRARRLEESRRELHRAIALAPEYALPHYELGKLLEQTTDLSEAVHELEECERLDPEFAQGWYALAQVYRKLGDRIAAERALARFRELKTEHTEDQALRDDLEYSTRLPR